ncbi:hypothetical protein [Streptomyces sp. DW26H14]|uniref:hypothetical protein n=1 Tax=Streptomyces sp. DW26H14 TaxID=3435395 RepID=UPI00403E203D
MLDDVTAPACVICRTELPAAEAAYQVCQRCERRIDADLTALAGTIRWEGAGSDRTIVAGLFAALPTALQRGSGGKGPSVSGTRALSLPVREEILSLVCEGGAAADLAEWVDDWAGRGYATPVPAGAEQQKIDAAVATLRFNLSRAAQRHPAIKAFADEIAATRRHWTNIIMGGPAGPILRATCDCGATLKYDLNTVARQCRSCHTVHEREDLLHSTWRERAAAA